MVPPDEMQAAIIELLKADANVSAAVNADIREADWQGSELTYPNVRVRLQPQYSRGDGNCRETDSVQTFTVEVYSEEASSQECSHIVGLVVNAVFGKRLSGTNWHSLQINTNGLLAPFRTQPRVWRGNASFIVRCY